MKTSFYWFWRSVGRTLLTLGLAAACSTAAHAQFETAVFGDVPLGQSSEQFPGYCNAGGGFLTTSTVFIDPASANPGDFAIVGDSCTGSALGNGQCCFIAVRFTPTAAGTRTANMYAVTNVGPLLIALTGKGIGPQELISSLTAQVDGLVSAGTLNQGLGTALTAKLSAALSQIDSGNKLAAAQQLAAFQNQVAALVNAGTLSSTQGAALSNAAQTIINQLKS